MTVSEPWFTIRDRTQLGPRDWPLTWESLCSLTMPRTGPPREVTSVRVEGIYYAVSLECRHVLLRRWKPTAGLRVSCPLCEKRRR